MTYTPLHKKYGRAKLHKQWTRQAMYVYRNNEALWFQRFLQRKSSKYYIFWLCICSLRYSACNAHTPYCHLWLSGCTIFFPHYLINGKI